MFLSTQKPLGLYNFLVGSTKMHAEKYFKKKLSLEILQNSKRPSVKYIIFLIYLIISLKIFGKKRIYIRYNNIEIGRFVMSETMKNLKSYVSKIYFYYKLLENFYSAGKNLNTCQFYLKNKTINAAYIDHCFGLNGIFYSYFGKYKVPIYTNNYPLNIFMVNFKKKKNIKLLKYENAIKIGNYNKNISRKKIEAAKKILKKMTFTKNYLPWMKKVKFTNLSVCKKDFSTYDYLIYVHSFTDGQLIYGNDEFENTYDWLDFTLNILKNKQKKIIVKPHPNFYVKSNGILSIYDKLIYNNILKKYQSNSNFLFLDKPIFNYDLLKKINNNCILITHHGSVLLEAVFLGFKTICSHSTFYDKNFKHTITWKNKKEYESLLSNENLKKKTYKNDLFILIDNLFFNNFSFYSKNLWVTIARKNLNINHYDFVKKIKIFSGQNNKLRKARESFFNSKINTKLSKIVYKIAIKISEIEVKKKTLKYSLLKIR
jgi:hypothetical protein